jgi:hypothetical protein
MRITALEHPELKLIEQILWILLSTETTYMTTNTQTVK